MLILLEWVGLIAWIVFTYASIFRYGKRTCWYGEARQTLLSYGVPPGWVFFPIWMIIYGLMAASIFVYWRVSTHTYYDVVLGLYFAHVCLNKVWSPLFFGVFYWWLALLVLFLMIGTGVIIVTFMAIDGAWVSFGLLIPVAVWLIYAFYLNCVFIAKVRRTEIDNRTRYIEEKAECYKDGASTFVRDRVSTKYL